MDSSISRTSIIPEKGDMFVASVYDILAKEHGPLFFAANFGLLWRNVDALVKQASNINPSEFLVILHGTFTVASHKKAFFSYDYPVYFSVDRYPLSIEAVSLLIQAAE